jgi:aspartyl aminopeptidase
MNPSSDSRNSSANSLINDLIDFIAASPTPFHAVATLRERLLAAGFTLLSEHEQWQLKPGGAYVVTRNDSSIIAFRVGTDLATSGVRMIGAHTDSPCLKVKPLPELQRNGFFQLGVEVYGGVLLNPWFDRDLGLAGRISYRDGKGDLKSALYDSKRAIGIIPSLAIHLDREVNNNRSINAQTHLPVVMGLVKNLKQTDFRAWLGDELKQQGVTVDKVLDYELSFYDTQRGAVVGIENDLVASARLDNLLSCFVGMRALIDADNFIDGKLQTQLLVFNDHEEVGSMSAAGAQGPMLKATLSRLVPDNEARERCLHNSIFVSVDNAHGVHPNFADRHDGNHGPLLNGGPVIKVNANQRYASNSETQAMFRNLCERANVPVQTFVVRTDMACGSTIGPITAAELGVKTVDVGTPQFAMHSIRELAGVEDVAHMLKALTAFYSS